MNDKDLIELLESLADEDLSSDSKVYDHPCSVAVRRIQELKKEFKDLQRCIRVGGKNKRCKTLMGSALTQNHRTPVRNS